MKRIIFILILASGSCLIYGQTERPLSWNDSSSIAIVKEAERLFNAGQYDRCSDLLESIPDTRRLRRSERMKIIEILAKTYIETDDLGKAESAVDLLLRNFPHYELKEEENSERFNRMVGKYRIHPLISVGMQNTMNFAGFKTMEVSESEDIFDYSRKYKTLREGIFKGFGLMYYAWGECEFVKDISVNPELIIMWTRFERSLDDGLNTSLYYIETDNYLEIPVTFRKYFHAGRNVIPYITAGMGWSYMTRATGKATIYFADKDSTATTGEINMLDMRNRNNYEWIAGFGVGYKYRNLRLFLDMRYSGGLTCFISRDNTLSNEMLITDYHYADNSVKLNQFEIGFSFSYTLINSVHKARPGYSRKNR